MIVLNLKDPLQGSLVRDTLVILKDGNLEIINGNNKFCFRISNNLYNEGNYWIDSANRVIMVEFRNSEGILNPITIYLGSQFEVLFPNAQENWASYFFYLHYFSLG